MQLVVKSPKAVSVLDNLILCLYSAYFILKPFYLWNSGIPQIADLTMVLLITVFFALKKRFTLTIEKKAKKIVVTGFILTYYVIIFNLLWLLILNAKDSFLLPSLYYMYNFLVLLLIIALYSEYKHKILKLTYKAALISVVLQMVVYVLEGGFSGGRTTVGFNNPNQLGYYGLLIICILIYTAKKLEVKIKWYILGICCSLVLVLASLSKAAILSTIGVIVFSLISNYKTILFTRKYVFLFLVGTLVFSYLYVFGKSQIPLLQSVERRISSIGQDYDDSLDGRGYLRVLEYPKYWLFGSGEGAYERFQSLTGVELHSTLGNQFVSYGIVGTVLLLLLFHYCLKNDNYRSWYLLFFVLLYGLTHNGIRNSLLWILLGIISLNYRTDMNKEELRIEKPNFK